MAICTGTTKKGEPCGAKAKRGTERCGRHPLDNASDTATERPRDERWSREGFLHCFEWCGMVSVACEMIGVARSTVYVERQRDEDFALAWADVEERSTERMEAEAMRRAVVGVDSALVSAGKLVTTERKYSDQLLMFMLKARRPEKYRDRVDVNHGGKIEQRVKLDLAKLPDEDLEALERIAAKLDAEPVTA